MLGGDWGAAEATESMREGGLGSPTAENFHFLLLRLPEHSKAQAG